MAKYRNNIEIVADVLTIAREKALKTQIMYRANLSFRLTERYLETVLSAGLVMLDVDGRYLVTDKGVSFLKKFLVYKVHAKGLLQKLERLEQRKHSLLKMCSPESNDPSCTESSVEGARDK